MNGCLVNPAEMYKKEIASLTEELAREKERSKAAKQDFETELARRELEYAELKKEQVELKKELDGERDLRKQVEKNAEQRIKSARQDFETVLARRELEQAELKKELDEERNLRKQVEKNAEERIKSARQDLETELARREPEQAELKKDLDEEELLPKQLETDANELTISIHGPDVSPSEQMAIVQKPDVQVESPSIPNGTYLIRNRTANIYWYASGWFHLNAVKYSKDVNSPESTHIKVNEHSPIIQVLKK